MKVPCIAVFIAVVCLAGLSPDSSAQTAAELTVNAVRLQPGESIKLDAATLRAPLLMRFRADVLAASCCQ